MLNLTNFQYREWVRATLQYYSVIIIGLCCSLYITVLQILKKRKVSMNVMTSEGHSRSLRVVPMCIREGKVR